MMKITEYNYMSFVDKFLDGLTTNEEEQALYRWFSRHDIPNEARPYREMFDWYSSLAPQNDTLHDSGRVNPFVRKFLSVAAAAIFVFTLASSVWQNMAIQREYLCYEGSYVIRDGKKITDMQQVVREMKAIDIEMRKMKQEIEDAQIQAQKEIQVALQNVDDEIFQNRI